MDLQITLSNLHEATAQQVFDQAALHLLTQNRKSKEDTKCAYRTKEGLRCAAGCFISEEEYENGGMGEFRLRTQRSGRHKVVEDYVAQFKTYC